MKITIITATYNCATTIGDTIESVLQQTHTDVEYIIVDGNSTDSTPQIVEHYRPQFAGRLVYIREADKGIYDAMNKGIRRATGDVVGLLNADDFFTSADVLERVAATLESQPQTDAVYGDVHYVVPTDLTRSVRYYSSRPFRRSWMRLGFMPAHPSFYCRRSVYERYGLFDTSYRVAADFELLLRFIFVHRIRTTYIPRDFVTMRTGGASTSGLSSHRQIMADHRRALRTSGVRSAYALLALRYVYKAGEVLAGKVSRRKR